MKALLCAALIAITTMPAWTQANMAGLGSTLCAELQPHFGDKRYRVALLAWTTGFHTGANMVLVARGEAFRNLNGLSEDGVVAAISTFCASNPGSPAIAAVERMYHALPLSR